MHANYACLLACLFNTNIIDLYRIGIPMGQVKLGFNFSRASVFNISCKLISLDRELTTFDKKLLHV